MARRTWIDSNVAHRSSRRAPRDALAKWTGEMKFRSPRLFRQLGLHGLWKARRRRPLDDRTATRAPSTASTGMHGRYEPKVRRILLFTAVVGRASRREEEGC